MKVILLLIIVLAAALRFLWLENYPPGVTADEIGQAYSAYSILETGKDEWGDYLPLNPRGFGDYKPPLLTYMLVPSIALFDLNIFATRFPSSLISTLTILVIFFLTKEIFNNSKIGLLAAFFTAISMWNVYYSRLAWESNIGCFALLLAIYLFLVALKHEPLMLLSAIFFGLSMFTYHSFKVLTPLMILGLFIVYRQRLIRFDRKWIFGALAIFLIFAWFIIYGYLFSGAGRRAADAAIYSSEHILALRNIQYEDKLPDPFRRIINNRPQFLLSEFSQNYLGYFSTTFLVSPHRSNSTLFNLTGQWLIAAWEFILIIIAVYFLIKKKILPENTKVIILIALISPIPAALTKDYMHAQRAQTLLFLIPILSAFGAYALFKKLSGFRRFIYLTILSLIIIWSFLVNTDQYLYHIFLREQGGLHFGYQEAILYVEKNKDKYDQIIFTKKQSEPQAFVAFYSKMDPVTFQDNSKNWAYFETSGFKFLDMINYKLDKYEFRDVNWSSDIEKENTLIVAGPTEVPENGKVLKEIKNLKDEVVFKIVDSNEN